MSQARPRGRYAPSPTGELHVGNASTALLAWLSVRSRGGAFVIRVEDLDLNRARPELVARILDDLRWLGLDWDEGPDLGGPHAPYAQGQRSGLYAAAFERLRRAERVYPCFCSRRDVAAAASAPQGAGDEIPYPGTCRALAPDVAASRIEAGERHSWRFRAGASVGFGDLVCGRYGDREEDGEPGDFVVLRADGVAAYQLAVVVDDSAMRIREVVRGDDLLPSTVKQLLLYRALELEPPRFGHVPLLLGPDRVRLAKRHAASALSDLRARGLPAEQVLGRLAEALGLRPDARPVAAHALVPGFDLSRLRAARGGIVVDPASWLCL